MNSLVRQPYAGFATLTQSVSNKHESINLRAVEAYTFGKICIMNVTFDTTTELANGTTLFTLPTAYLPDLHNAFTAWCGTGGEAYAVNLDTSGNISVNRHIDGSKTYLRVLLPYLLR